MKWISLQNVLSFWYIFCARNLSQRLLAHLNTFKHNIGYCFLFSFEAFLLYCLCNVLFFHTNFLFFYIGICSVTKWITFDFVRSEENKPKLCFYFCFNRLWNLYNIYNTFNQKKYALRSLPESMQIDHRKRNVSENNSTLTRNYPKAFKLNDSFGWINHTVQNEKLLNVHV